MLLAAAILLVLLAFAFPLAIRSRDLPEPETTPATFHLEQRRATIYENLRDLQGEYLMGKLSDDDYQETKKELQGELAQVMAQIEAESSSEEAA